jgi:hypothetical protein
MPFTPAHVAAVVPLRGRPLLPFAALAAGAMSPDVAYYLPGGWVPFPGTHTPAGILTWDLAFGVALWLAWRWATPALHDLAPEPVRVRWQPPASPVAAWWAIPVAVAIGAVTHVGWDEFTHPGRWGTAHVPALAASWSSPLGALPGYQWAQYASGGLGLAVLAWVALRRPRTAAASRRLPSFARFAPVAVMGVGVSGALFAVATLTGPVALPRMAFVAVTSGTAAGLVALTAVCVAHQIVEVRRSGRVTVTTP